MHSNECSLCLLYEYMGSLLDSSDQSQWINLLKGSIDVYIIERCVRMNCFMQLTPCVIPSPNMYVQASKCDACAYINSLLSLWWITCSSYKEPTSLSFSICATCQRCMRVTMHAFCFPLVLLSTPSTSSTAPLVLWEIQSFISPLVPNGEKESFCTSS